MPIEAGLRAAREQHEAQRRDRVAALRSEIGSLADSWGADSPWVLELGCGHGHFLSAFAQRYVHHHCVGVDFCRDRIRRAERKRQRAGLTNLHFLHAEIGEFLDALPPELGFSQVFVLFPDPWPKRRHRKHRLVSGDLLARLATWCAAGSGFFFRSDALDYVAEVRELFATHARWRLSAEQELPLETETVFQARAAHYGSVAATLVS